MSEGFSSVSACRVDIHPRASSFYADWSAPNEVSWTYTGETVFFRLSLISNYARDHAGLESLDEEGNGPRN